MSYMSKIMQFQEKLYRAWNNNNIMLDIFSVLNQHNFTITTSDLRAMFSNNLNIIPLINLNHINDELIDFLYQLRIENFIQTVSFRINSETPPQSNAFISTICERLNINPITTTIIYDLGNISEQNYVYFERMFRSLFNDFSYPHNNLVILSGSFYIPIDMSSNSNCTIARNDWIFWLQLQSTLELTSNFGDYTVSPVLFQDIPFRGAPKIKYTLENNWYISKGTTPRTYDQRNAVQFRSLAEQILQSSDWTNLNCYGDQQLNDCANGNIEIGSHPFLALIQSLTAFFIVSSFIISIIAFHMSQRGLLLNPRFTSAIDNISKASSFQVNSNTLLTSTFLLTDSFLIFFNLIPASVSSTKIIPHQ